MDGEQHGCRDRSFPSKFERRCKEVINILNDALCHDATPDCIVWNASSLCVNSAKKSSLGSENDQKLIK
jgi:hypothetical protein